MTRKSIPKRSKDAVLKEYRHRCAVCGGDDPHIHHIDENHSNNLLENLLPLCPNCHLRDQHNPTRMIEVPKLGLFRRYKDPSILKSQFHPVYARQLFLDSVVDGSDSTDELEGQATELVELVQALELGSFYATRLLELIGPPSRPVYLYVDGSYDSAYERELLLRNRKYREQLIANREAAKALLVEQTRYQSWANRT